MEEIKNSPKKATGTEKKVAEIKTPELLDMLKAGSHFGHKTSAWNPKMKKYIYEKRNGVHIIDLIQTQKLLKEALEELSKVVDRGNVLIIGTKGQAASIVEKMALETGAFYINKRWPGGLFTNFDIVKKSVNKLLKMEENLASGGENLVKKEILLMERDVERLNKLYKGIKFMDELPKMIIVVDSKVEKNAIKEAKIAGIPVVALIDTNCDPDSVDFPIPANDDSIKSISLFVDTFGEVIKKGIKADSLKSLRKNHDATMKSLQDTYTEEVERKKKMEEEERLRLKRLREGVESTPKMGGIVRVVKKEKDIEAEIAAAEEVKAQSDSKSISELGLSSSIEKNLQEAGINTVSDIVSKTKEDLMEVKGIGEKTAEKILESIK